jgi:hypothetical protein
VTAWKRREQRHARRFAALMAMLANIHRDSEKHPEPFTVEDFMGEKRTVRKRKSAAALREQRAKELAFFRGLVARGLAEEVKL